VDEVAIAREGEREGGGSAQLLRGLRGCGDFVVFEPRPKVASLLSFASATVGSRTARVPAVIGAVTFAVVAVVAAGA
jgi:hypothetical protein